MSQVKSPSFYVEWILPHYDKGNVKKEHKMSAECTGMSDIKYSSCRAKQGSPWKRIKEKEKVLCIIAVKPYLYVVNSNKLILQYFILDLRPIPIDISSFLIP